MSSNSLGKIFTFTTWGESHGRAIGCVVDGVPSKIKLSQKDIQSYLNKRTVMVLHFKYTFVKLLKYLSLNGILIYHRISSLRLMVSFNISFK